MAEIDARGREILDSTPIELPLGYSHPEPLAMTIARLVRDQISREAAARGQDSFEEFDNFDVADEDPDPVTRYEVAGQDLDADLNGKFKTRDQVDREKKERAAAAFEEEIVVEKKAEKVKAPVAEEPEVVKDGD